MYAAFFLLPITFYGLFNPVVTLSSEDQTFLRLVFALIRTGTTLFEVPQPHSCQIWSRITTGETNGWRYVMHLAGPAVMAFT